MEKIETKNISTNSLLRIILAEVKSLRKDLDLVLPQENLSDYSHPKRIKSSLAKALTQFPKDHASH